MAEERGVSLTDTLYDICVLSLSTIQSFVAISIDTYHMRLIIINSDCRPCISKMPIYKLLLLFKKKKKKNKKKKIKNEKKKKKEKIPNLYRLDCDLVKKFLFFVSNDDIIVINAFQSIP